MSSVIPITASATGLDLSSRHAGSVTVVGSPATSGETIVASITIPSTPAIVSGVRLEGWCAFTAGTNGVGATLKLRQTSTSGATIATSGAMTIVATDLYGFTILGFDSAPAAGQVYKLTLTIASGSATSAVSAVYLGALII